MQRPPIFPPVDRPYLADIEASPDSVRKYIGTLEQRVDDLDSISRLLMEMDVFPDIRSSIRRLVEQRRRESETTPTPSEGPEPPGL